MDILYKMTDFTSLLTTLETGTTAKKKIDSATTYQGSQAYSDYLAEKQTASNTRIKTVIANSIMSHFNNIDDKSFNVSKSDLVINVSRLDANSQAELDSELTSKGYICAMNGDYVTISTT